ncbi:MAG: DUF4340 domain-containing protein [Planctomycetes bacterium]|nr:DUF4340 domain-containing protein [Planctomycetota bacterium]
MKNPQAEREQIRTLVYVGVTVLLVLLTAIDPFSSSAKAPELASGGTFFPELTSLDQARALEVFEWDKKASAHKAFKVEFKDGVWQIPSKEGYPADAQNKIGKIASALMAIEKGKLRTSREEDHVRLGVVDPKAKSAVVEGVGYRLRLLGANDEVLADLIVGKEVEGSTSERYVRKMNDDVGEPRVYAAAFALELDTDFSSWIDTDLLHLDVAQISSLTIDRQRLEIGIDQASGRRFGQLIDGQKSSIGQADYTWSVEGMGEDHEAAMTVIDKMTETLKELAIKNVLKRNEAALNDVGFYPLAEGYFSNEGQIRVDLKDGVTYVLRFGNASAATGDPQRFLIVENELCQPIYAGLSAEGKKKADQRVLELSARFKDWFYLISAKDFESLRPKHSTLTEKKESEDDLEDDDDPPVEIGPTPDDVKDPPFPTPRKVEGDGPPPGGAKPPKVPGGEEPPKKTSSVKNDAEAERLFKQATKGEVWNGDPKIAQALLEQALGTAKSKALRVNLTLVLGNFQQGKTGDFAAAIKSYQRVIGDTVGEKAPAMRNFKAQALMNLGIIYYTRQHDLDQAVVKLSDSIEVSATAKAADVLSQLLFRIARDGKRSETARKAQLEKALKIGRLAEKLDTENADKKQTPARTVKIKLQLAIVLEALGQGALAKTTFGVADEKTLSNDGLYQLAVLRSLRGASAAEVAGPLHEALKLRPGAVARNQMRWFIRTEPDLAKHRADPSWKTLVTDEPVK